MPAQTQRRRRAKRRKPSSLAARRAPKPWPPAVRVLVAVALVVFLSAVAFLFHQREHRITTQREIEEQRFLDDFDRRAEELERHARTRTD